MNRLRTLVRAATAVLFVAIFALSSAAKVAAQAPVDTEVRTAYDQNMAMLKTMAGDMKEDERKTKMLAFQDAMRKLAEKYEARSGELSTAHLDLARAYLHLADPAKVESHILAFLQKCPQSPDVEEARMLLADAYGSMNRNDEAATIYEQVLAANPKGDKAPFAHFLLGKSKLFGLDYDAAIAEFKFVRANYADHKVYADAAMLLVNALENSGKADEARALIGELLAANKDAPDLQRRSAVLEKYGKEAPDLVNVQKWIGSEGSNLTRLRGRVVVLCFFANMYVNCTRELQVLSDLDKEFANQGVTFWGITKTYKFKADAKEANTWTFDQEAEWLAKYRENPGFVLARELRAPKPTKEDEKKNWESLAQPITIPIALSTGFDNHKAYDVRGVPYVVVVDKAGKIRFIQEGAGSKDDFPHRALKRVVQRLNAE